MTSSVHDIQVLLPRARAWHDTQVQHLADMELCKCVTCVTSARPTAWHPYDIECVWGLAHKECKMLCKCDIVRAKGMYTVCISTSSCRHPRGSRKNGKKPGTFGTRKCNIVTWHRAYTTLSDHEYLFTQDVYRMPCTSAMTPSVHDKHVTYRTYPRELCTKVWHNICFTQDV